MSLFGQPNIKKYRKKGRIRKLVKLLNNKDHQIEIESLKALMDITNDETLDLDRKENWLLNFHYEGALKAIRKLNKEQQTAIEQLTQKLVKEKEDLVRKLEAKKQTLDELKKQFLKSFNSEGFSEKNFYTDLLKILGENKRFLYTLKMVNTRQLGEFNGVIVTTDEIIYFELNVFHKVMGIRFDEMQEFIFKDGIFNKSIKVINKSGGYIKIPVDDGDKEMIDFIKSKINISTHKQD
jgi:hypothetical protein